jgi:hypothetical protein
MEALIPMLVRPFCAPRPAAAPPPPRAMRGSVMYKCCATSSPEMPNFTGSQRMVRPGLRLDRPRGWRTSAVTPGIAVTRLEMLSSHETQVSIRHRGRGAPTFPPPSACRSLLLYRPSWHGRNRGGERCAYRRPGPGLCGPAEVPRTVARGAHFGQLQRAAHNGQSAAAVMER